MLLLNHSYSTIYSLPNMISWFSTPISTFMQKKSTVPLTTAPDTPHPFAQNLGHKFRLLKKKWVKPIGPTLTTWQEPKKTEKDQKKSGFRSRAPQNLFPQNLGPQFRLLQKIR